MLINLVVHATFAFTTVACTKVYNAYQNLLWNVGWWLDLKKHSVMTVWEGMVNLHQIKHCRTSTCTYSSIYDFIILASCRSFLIYVSACHEDNPHIMLLLFYLGFTWCLLQIWCWPQRSGIEIRLPENAWLVYDHHVRWTVQHSVQQSRANGQEKENIISGFLSQIPNPRYTWGS